MISALKLKNISSTLILRLFPRRLIRFFKQKLSLNYFFFGESVRDTGTYVVSKTQNDFVSMDESQLGSEVYTGFKEVIDGYRRRPGLFREYLLCVEDCVVEPQFGWGVTLKHNKLIFDSISNNGWTETYYPSFRSYLNGKQHAASIEEAVSINMIPGGENNYWHFLHDLLGAVALARKHVSADCFFLISKALSEKAFFQQALALSPALANTNWLIRDKYFLINKAWFAQVMPNSMTQFFAVRQFFSVEAKSVVGQKKIFLKRSDKRIRFLNNSQEIEDICHQNDIEVIDTDGYSLAEQIHFFRDVRLMIGIHGAGLTNQIFCSSTKLTLFELLPKDYLQPHYFLLNQGLGYNYQHLVGSKSEADTSFYINPQAFKIKLASILNGIKDAG